MYLSILKHLIMQHFTENVYNTKRKTATAIIAEIHNEFDTAGDKLLAEANAIIAKDFDTSKGDRLKKLGFGLSKSAVVSDKNIAEKKENTELIKNILHFRTYYPAYKFITDEVVKTICEKYGLVFGPADKYIGDIPEKNVAEIETFKLRKEDFIDEKATWSSMDFQDLWDRANRHLERKYMPIGPISLIGSSELSVGPYQAKTKKPAFKIVAPEKDFNMQNMQKKGHKIELHIPDPIVLQPVKGGYLIISKWGLEGEDKELVNEVLN